MPICSDSGDKFNCQQPPAFAWTKTQLATADNNDENQLPPDSLDDSSSSNDSQSFTKTVDHGPMMDELVSSLSLKLRLKSSTCLPLSKQRRISPYSMDASQVVKGRNRTSLGYANHEDNSMGKNEQKVKVPCQLMRELLDNQALINEAVKRLQLKKTSNTSQHSSDLGTLGGICDTIRTGGKLDIKGQV